MTVVRRRNRYVTEKQRNLIAGAEAAASRFQNRMFGEMYLEAVKRAVLRDDKTLLDFMSHLERPPADIESFIDSEEFLGSTDLTLWPNVRAAIVEINKNWWKGPDWRDKHEQAHLEAVLKGATGTGKTSIAIVTTLYHSHLLGCLRHPQAVYGLPRATTIVFPIMAAKPHVTKRVIYTPLRRMLEVMPWFQKHMPLDKLVESNIVFADKNVQIVMGGADADSILGDAVIGGIIDEINFMNVVLRSRKAEVSSGRVGVYDQAQSIYETMTRRKRGRFLSRGPCIGVIVVASSTRYKKDFTDRRHSDIIEKNERNVYVYDKAQYEVWPSARYSGEKFRLLVGNDVVNDLRILEHGEAAPEGARVIDVPVEYLGDFRKNPHDALRDIVGISSSSVSPFIRNRFHIQEAMLRGEERGLESILIKDNVILGVDGMPQVKLGHYCANPSRPRYVHIDLSVTGDRCGVTMLCFDGLTDVTRRTAAGVEQIVEKLPKCTVEMALSIEPDANNEINIAEVRSWVKMLKTRYGYPIKAVTYDGYMSVESLQQWKKDGMATGQVSVDRTSVPYKQLRDAFAEGRIDMYGSESSMLVSELFDLEYDETKDKVDHPVNGFKDIADSLCGAYTTLVTRRASWIQTAYDDQAIEKEARYSAEDRYDNERR